MNSVEVFLLFVSLSFHKNNSYLVLAIQILQKPFLEQFIHPKNIFLLTDSILEIPQGYILSRNQK